MFGFKNDSLYSKLVNLEVEEICFASSQFSLSFGNNSWIVIMGEIEILGYSGSLEYVKECAEPMMRFVGDKIKKIRIENSSKLVIEFENNSLALIDDPHYESFVFNVGGVKVYV